MVDIEDVVLH